MTASSDVAGRSVRRRFATPNLDASDPRAEQLQLIADRSDYPVLQELFQRRASIQDSIEYWLQAIDDLYDAQQYRHDRQDRPARLARRDRIDEYAKQGVYTELSAQQNVDELREQLRQVEREIRDQLPATGSLRRANSEVERQLANRARNENLDQPREPAEQQRLAQRYARMARADNESLDAMIENLEVELEAAREGLADVRRALRADDPAKRDRLAEDIALLRLAEKEARELLQNARRLRAERADPQRIAYLENRASGADRVTREEALRELLLLDPSPEREAAIDRVRADLDRLIQNLKNGKWSELWDEWGASDEEEFTYAIQEALDNDRPDLMYIGAEDIGRYGDPLDAINELQSWIDRLEGESRFPRDHPAIMEEIANAEMLQEQIGAQIGQGGARIVAAVNIGGNAPRPNPPPAIPDISGKADTGWQQGLIPEGEVPVRPELSDLVAAREFIRQGGDLAEVPDDVLVQALFLDGVTDSQGDEYEWDELIFQSDSRLSAALENLLDEPLENERFTITLTKIQGLYGPWSQWAVFKVQDKTTGEIYFLKANNYGTDDAIVEAVGYDVARILGFKYDEKMGQVRLGIHQHDDEQYGAVRWQLQPHVANGQDTPPLDDPSAWADAAMLIGWSGQLGRMSGDDVAMLLVLDYLMDNLDRHNQNWQVAQDDEGIWRILPIDMGLVLGGRMTDMLMEGIVSDPADWDGFLEARAQLLPVALAKDTLGTTIFSFDWDPGWDDRELATAKFDEIIARIGQINVDDLFDPARFERKGAKLTAAERAHLAAGKQLFLTRLAIIEEMGPQIFWDAFA
jgi:TolA-binding protein